MKTTHSPFVDAHTDSIRIIPPSVLACILIFEIGLFLCYLKMGLRITLGLGLVMPFIIWTLQNFKNYVLLFFLYLAFIPTSAWGERYAFFHGFAFKPIIYYGFMISLLLYFWIEKIKQPFSNRGLDKRAAPWFWIILVVFATINGFKNGQTTYVAITEMVFLGSYGLLFIFYDWFNRISPVKVWSALIWIGAATAILYLLLFMTEGGPQGIRIVTRQTHVMLAFLPLIISRIFVEHSSFKKICFALMASVIMLAIIISQQRGLWVGTTVSLCIFIGLYVLQPGSKKKKLRILFLALILFSAVLFLLIVTQPATSQLLFKRVLSLLWGFSDPSMQLRISDTQRVLAQWQKNCGSIMIGSGLGAQFESIDPMRTSPYFIDHSWIYLLWKTGFIGLGLFILLFLRTLISGFKAVKYGMNHENRMLAAGILSGLSGLIVVSFTNGCLVFYRFIPIWSLMMSTLLFLNHSQDKHKVAIS